MNHLKSIKTFILSLSKQNDNFLKNDVKITENNILEH